MSVMSAILQQYSSKAIQLLIFLLSSTCNTFFMRVVAAQTANKTQPECLNDTKCAHVVWGLVHTALAHVSVGASTYSSSTRECGG